MDKLMLMKIANEVRKDIVTAVHSGKSRSSRRNLYLQLTYLLIFILRK